MSLWKILLQDALCTNRGQMGRLKNAHELLNRRALKFKFSHVKTTSFNEWVKYFVWKFKGTLWNSTQNILSINWKIWFLYNIEILRALRFKGSYSFLNWPHGILCWWCYSILMDTESGLLATQSSPGGSRTISGVWGYAYNSCFTITVKCRYNAVFGVQEIDRVIAVTAL